jgi:hypothetical protein
MTRCTSCECFAFIEQLYRDSYAYDRKVLGLEKSCEVNVVEGKD